MFKKLFRSKSHPYSRAAKLFGQLRYLDDNGQQYWINILDIAELCMEAIQLDKFDGGAHVLLANTYLLGAFGAITKSKPEGYVTSISKCAAVIYEWKTIRECIQQRRNRAKRSTRKLSNDLKTQIQFFRTRTYQKILADCTRIFTIKQLFMKRLANCQPFFSMSSTLFLLSFCQLWMITLLYFFLSLSAYPYEIANPAKYANRHNREPLYIFP